MENQIYSDSDWDFIKIFFILIHIKIFIFFSYFLLKSSDLKIFLNVVKINFYKTKFKYDKDRLDKIFNNFH
jgi:hypothetical protein